MANMIRVTPDKLTSASSQFLATAGEVKSLTSNMTSTVQQLTGNVWSGEAASAYTSKFNSLQADINKLYTMIKTHSEHLSTIAKAYGTGESENQATANALSSSVL